MRAFTLVFTDKHIYTCMCVVFCSTRTHTHARTHTRTHIHTCTHAHALDGCTNTQQEQQQQQQDIGSANLLNKVFAGVGFHNNNGKDEQEEKVGNKVKEHTVLRYPFHHLRIAVLHLLFGSKGLVVVGGGVWDGIVVDFCVPARRGTVARLCIAVMLQTLCLCWRHILYRLHTNRCERNTPAFLPPLSSAGVLVCSFNRPTSCRRVGTKLVLF